MIRKSALLASVFGALVAFAAPAVAGAAPSLTMPVGTLVPKATVFVATSTNTVFTDVLGNHTCEVWTFSAEVTENSGTKIEGVGVGEGTSFGCRLGSSPVTVTRINLLKLSSTVAGHGAMTVSFTEDLPGLTCSYESESGGTPFIYVAGASSIHVSGTLKATPAACGPETVSGDFALATKGGGSLIVD
jgi:hypothetical protein